MDGSCRGFVRNKLAFVGGFCEPLVVRNKLAFIGGFLRASQGAPHGTNHAGYAICCAIARSKAFEQIDAYHDHAAYIAEFGAMGDQPFEVPENCNVRLCDRAQLPARSGEYRALFASSGEPVFAMPHGVRPMDDWAPVISEIDIAHTSSQWTHLFFGAVSGFVRPTDGFVFKSRAAQQVFVNVWNDWRERFGGLGSFPRSLVSYNAIDADDNRRSEPLRAETRGQLGLSPNDVMFLAFSRVERGFKGDPRAIIVQWREVVSACPNAVLVLSGATARHDRPFAESLDLLARQVGIGDRVIVVHNPYELWSNARNRLMSAADAFLHLTTGLEETCPLVVLEAMSHGVPPITSAWSGLRETIRHGETGWLVPTWHTTVPASVAQAYLSRDGLKFSTDVVRSAGCDTAALTSIVTAVASNPALRLQVGERAARAVRESFDLPSRVAERIEFINQVAQEAEAAWSDPTRRAKPGRPLVDVTQVLSVLAARRLTRADIVTLERAQDTAFVLGFVENRAVFDAIVASLEATGPATVADLAANVLSGDALAEWTSRPDAAAEFDQLLMQLLSYGVVAANKPGTPAGA